MNAQALYASIVAIGAVLFIIAGIALFKPQGPDSIDPGVFAEDTVVSDAVELPVSEALAPAIKKPRAASTKKSYPAKKKTARKQQASRKKSTRAK